MKRSHFFISLFSAAGLLKAQNSYRVDPGTIISSGMPANGECPLCRTKAPTIKQYFKVGVPKNCKNINEYMTLCDSVDVPGLEKNQLTRCKNCNNAFFQDPV